jgi:hypothetical protein
MGRAEAAVLADDDDNRRREDEGPRGGDREARRQLTDQQLWAPASSTRTNSERRQAVHAPTASGGRPAGLEEGASSWD